MRNDSVHRVMPQPDAVAFRVLKHGESAHTFDVRWRNNDGGASRFRSRYRSVQVVNGHVDGQVGSLVFIHLMNTAVNAHTRLRANRTNGCGLIDIPSKDRSVKLTQGLGMTTADLEMNNWIRHD